MPTLSKDHETRIQNAIEATNNGRFPNLKAAHHYYYNYDVACARRRGRKGNTSRGGNNKKLTDTEEATLVLYCERCILVGQDPEKQHIKAAANTILRAAAKKPVSTR